MRKNKLISFGLGLSATVSMVACSPASAPTAPAFPSASPSASPSPTASAPVASPTPVASPSQPIASPSASAPVASPSPSAPAGSPSPSASPTLPPVVVDIAIGEKTTFNGKIFDDTQSPVDGVTVKAKSLNSSIPYEASTLTAGGTYAFNNAPAGVQLEIVASKAGFTTRKRVEVLKSNKQGDPNANRYDFGNDGSTTNFSPTYNALSDKPEVVMVTPARNGSGVDPKTSFVLKFSEPMDKKTAEDTFTVRSFTTRKLTVDNGNLRAGADNNTVTGASNGIPTIDGSQIWDKDAFNISWNSDDTEATFSFKEEKLLPTDKDSNLVPDYQVAFRAFSNNDRVLKDKSGISRDDKHFKLTDGDFEQSYKFAIKTDEVKPTVSSIIAQTGENAGSNGDAVSVRYSERMIIYTRSRTIAGGMENVAGADTKAAGAYPTTNAVANSRDVAKNYTVRFVTGTTTNYSGNWWALGGTAVYDTTDVTHKTVLLLPPTVPAGITAQAATVAGNTATINLTYTDGTTESVTGADLGANVTFANLQANLNTATAANLFTVSATSDGGTANQIDGNDTFTITMAAGIQRGGKTIFAGWITTAGAFANTRLNKSGEPLYFTAGSGAGTKGNVYKPGDTVRVEVGGTVLDPAGNTIDTSRNNASANAS